MEIKFRAWDWDKMIDNFILKSYWWAFTYDNLADLEWWDKIIENQRLNYVMQYTGLKDCNWKEIYEWDIVIYNKDNFLVEWDNKRCWFFLKWKHPAYSDIKWYLKLSWKTLRVIWNIHENSNLINNYE